MCLLLPPRLYRYAHTHIHTLTLFFSSSHFSFKHNSFARKKANCILQQKSRKECCLPSALAPTAQVELGLNEYRAGQPGVSTGPSLPEWSWKQKHWCKRQPTATPAAPQQTRPGQPGPSHPAKGSAAWKRCPHILQTGGGDKSWWMQKLGGE